MAKSLNPISFPLYGERLIEASAGTGKTYTITGLYLRLLLGHGIRLEQSANSLQDFEQNSESEQTAFPRKLLVDEILVVTFTEAATQELKDRIRVRIKEARKAFEAYLEQQALPSDPALKELVEGISDTRDAIETLRYAERQMDEAAIFTIHGFCMRMLQQHAFESGSLFNAKMCEDDRELKFQAVKDFWRQQFYPLPTALVQVVLECWASPEALLSETGYLLSDTSLNFYNDYSIEDIESAHASYVAAIDEFKAKLRSGIADLHSAIISDVQNKQLDGRSFSKNNVAKWATAVERWATQETKGYVFPKELEHFGQAKLESKAKGELTVDWSLAETIQNFVDQPPELKPALKQHAIKICRTIYKKHKSQLGLLTFDDQISTMANALADGKSGAAFAQKLRTQYPVAMVDEFQDTDQSQYQIFSHIYGRENQQSNDHQRETSTDKQEAYTGLFMIGDPKQAIYAFRGGDIFTYMKARKKVIDQYTLGINWRSSASMVTAVNQLFSSAASPFMYDQDIPFDAVDPSPKAHSMTWTIAGEPQSALRLWQPDTSELIAKDSDYLQLMTEATANEVARLLTLSDQGHLQLISSKSTSSLEPSKIAILVRNFGQAQRIRSALAERGIASVYSSDRSSVFEQLEAKVLLRVLKAALMPESESLVKAAIGSDLFGWNLGQLNRLNEDELAWEQMVLHFRRFHKTWSTQGVLPAFHALMAELEIAVYLRKQVNGERRLTDLLHLCELLQNQSRSVESQYALVTWLEERIQQPNQNAQEQQLRLESEANLVKVVTYHKSKGLEYDVVFAPYVSYFWPNRHNGVSVTHDKDGNSVVDVTEQRQAEAAQERIAEDVRLLYVTLTRSVYACYLGLPGLMPGTKTKPDPKVCPKYMSDTGLGWLIGQGKAVSPDDLDASIQRWLEANNQLTETPVVSLSQPNIDYCDYVAPKQTLPELHLQKFSGQLDYNWWVTSYSRLVSESHSARELPVQGGADDHRQEQSSGTYDASVETKGEDAVILASDLTSFEVVERSGEGVDGRQPPEGVSKELLYDIHHFPKGAEAGTFLHLLFEDIEYQTCREDVTVTEIHDLLMKSPLSQQLIEQELPNYRLIGKSESEVETLKNQVIDRWVTVLHRMMINVLTHPLVQSSAQEVGSKDLPMLSETAPEQRLVEMEFLLPLAELDCRQVNAIIQQDPLTAKAAHGLSFPQVQGMLKGFIDLTFEYQGKFYVLDWKSNYLGEDASYYTQDAMKEAMLDHRYDFQYQLYTLALHRYLKSRLPGYDYDSHIGGAYYIFLRGVDASPQDPSAVRDLSTNGIFFTKPDRAMIEALDDLFAGAGFDSAQKVEATEPDDNQSETLSTFGDQGELF
ncbi:exodeoxyribonuclease V subunit beta [Litoribrevibacter albus]|uniref:RecBCD enzyme subunit RecB n=1 Tax=Litoribrevibacter albus TaxID=1473156 RepID=A0AA37SAH8_9GAMM|nr:exodeoxyribonuclease V subunit beta [Litoribrevibacter albus]GLQ31764.1 RecBCD enzyme subunit RecB [Litoribrevibacter albus]